MNISESTNSGAHLHDPSPIGGLQMDELELRWGHYRGGSQEAANESRAEAAGRVFSPGSCLKAPF